MQFSLSVVEAGPNELSKVHSGVELCVSNPGNAHHTVSYYTNANRGAVLNGPGKAGREKNRWSRKAELKKWWWECKSPEGIEGSDPERILTKWLFGWLDLPGDKGMEGQGGKSLNDSGWREDSLIAQTEQ